MRISVRTQLCCLFMLSGLIAIAVVSLASWITVRNFVLNLRNARYGQVAALKAGQLALSLQTLDDTVVAVTRRKWLQSLLQSNANGTITPSLLSDSTSDLITALTGAQQQSLALQAAIWPARDSDNNHLSPLLNATSPDAQNPQIKFPYLNPDGSPGWLGGPVGGLPPNLYPNLTIQSLPNNPNATWYNGRQLDETSSVFLGPMIMNDSLVLFSITRAVTDTNTTAVLGWLTVVLDGRLILKLSQDPVAMGQTGLNLIAGPFTPDNKFPNTSQDRPYYTLGSSIGDQDVHLVMPPARNAEKPNLPERPQAATKVTDPWKLSKYPAANQAFMTPWSDLAAGGADLAAHNEYGRAVGVGYASPKTSLVDWIIMAEYSNSEVYQPIVNLRRVILISVFSTLAALIVTVIPITSIWVRPVRRLRAATAETIAHYSETDSLTEKPANAEESPDSNQSPKGIERRGTRGTLQSWRDSLFSMTALGTFSDRPPAHKRKDMHKLTGANSQFRIPQRVPERRLMACIKDELSDLTHVFNEMSDELSLQYARLEERVKERTAELEKSKKAAEAANESKTLFIANISHELKTPLNGILGMAGICMKEQDPKRIREAFRIIYHSGDLLHNLLTDLLTFSKNQAGQALALEEKRFRLHDIPVQLRAIFDHQATKKGVDLAVIFGGPGRQPAQPRSVSFAEDPDLLEKLVLVGDQNRILQVMVNLVGNALKFTPKNGTVWLRIRQAHENTSEQKDFTNPWGDGPQEIEMGSQSSSGAGDKSAADIAFEKKALAAEIAELRATTQDDDTQSISEQLGGQSLQDLPVGWFELEVQDTGPGIPKDFQQKIFDPFVQGDVSLARKHGGTGLGLSICSQLAKLMHGSMSVDSEPDHGSTFCLRIPLRILGKIEIDVESEASQSSETLPSQTQTDRRESAAVEQGIVSPVNPARSASVVSKLSKPRLIGLSQPFFSEIPTPPMASPMSESGPTTPKAKQQLRVLIAEDNETNRKVVVRLLELEEIPNITVAKDGEEAFEKVKESLVNKNPFDLILMDVQMPIMDGRQSTKLIRQVGFTAP